jgi:short-subunit dehydrogenase
MRKGVQKEVALLTGIAAAGAFLAGKKNLSAVLAGSALAFRFLPLSPNYSYRDKVVMITGGSRGFGLALAENLARQGAKLWLLARDNAELGRAHEQLLKIRKADVNTLVADVTEPTDLDRAFRAAMARHGRIDVLINNAGAVAAAPFESTDHEDYEAQLELHLYAVISATRMIVPYFRASGGGRIVNISSLGGKMPLPHMNSYATSKFALAGFSSSVATELRADNIFVTTAYPGLMRTGSPIQGVFKGDAEGEFGWFLAGDIMPFLSIGAERAADSVLEAARRGDSSVIVSIAARAGAFMFQHFPEIYTSFAAVAAGFLPQKQSSGHRTGAASKGGLEKSFLGRRLLARNEKYARRWNQWEKFDAAKNLNLANRDR